MRTSHTRSHLALTKRGSMNAGSIQKVKKFCGLNRLQISITPWASRYAETFSVAVTETSTDPHTARQWSSQQPL